MRYSLCDKINSDEASDLNISYFSKPVNVSGVMREIANLLALENQLDDID